MCVFSGDQVIAVVKEMMNCILKNFSSLLSNQYGKKSNPLPETIPFPEAVYRRKTHQELNSKRTFYSNGDLSSSLVSRKNYIYHTEVI